MKVLVLLFALLLGGQGSCPTCDINVRFTCPLTEATRVAVVTKWNKDGTVNLLVIKPGGNYKVTNVPAGGPGKPGTYYRAK